MVTERDLANTVLSPEQLEVWILADKGLGQRTIALALGISRSAVRDRLENARRNIARAQRKEPA